MKKTITIASCIAVLALSSCKQDKFDYGSVGTLSFANCELSVSEDLNRVTKAAEAADDSYMLYLYDTSNGSLVWEKNYGTVKAMTDGVSLPAGEYRHNV